MSREENAAIVRRYIEEAWNQGNPDALDEFLASGYVDHTYQPPTVEGVRNMIQLLNASFAGHHTTIEDQVTEGDTSMMRFTYHLPHTGSFRGIPPSGKQLKVEGYRLCRLADGKIVEQWVLLDNASLQQQLQAPSSAEQGQA